MAAGAREAGGCPETMGTLWAMTGSGFPTQESTLDAVGGSGEAVSRGSCRHEEMEVTWSGDGEKLPGSMGC